MAGYTKQEAQNWAWEALRGHWTTLITPFTSDDEVDEPAIRHNIRHVRSLGTRGAGCSWGMGEFWSLTHQERLKVLDVTADEAAGKWPIGAHVTHTSAKDMLALADHAEAVGFDLLIVAPPYMVTKTEDQVVDWVRMLADRTNLAIMFYNSPQFNIVMSPQGLQRLCEIPNVVGVKEASFNQQISIETHLLLGKDHVISTPEEWIYWRGRDLGFNQQVLFSNTSDWRFDSPEANYYVQFIERASQGDLDEVFYDLHLRRIKGLSDKWWGETLKRFGGALPISMIKYWGELMGLKAGHVRPPLADLTQNEKEELGRELIEVRPRPVVTASPPIHATVRPHAPWLNTANPTFSGMMLLVSVQNMEEALEADKGGADIIDVKNLQEALVGSGHPNLVREVRDTIPEHKHISVTLGVVPNQAGTVAMAVHAAALLNATSVKVGFCEASYEDAVEVLRESRRALTGSATKLVGSLFADNELYGGLDPYLMVKLATEGECDGLLIDTLTKDGRNLFDFMPEGTLREMVLEAKQLGLSTALSGHLRLENLDELARINPDIVGVRGAVCRSGEREAAVAWEAVAHFKNELDLRKSGEIDVHHQTNGNGNGTTSSASNGSGWAVIDGRGKNCAGVIAALTNQIAGDRQSFVEAILHDALNIYDVIYWAEQSGHRLVTQRNEPGGLVRVLIQPHSNGH